MFYDQDETVSTTDLDCRAHRHCPSRSTSCGRCAACAPGPPRSWTDAVRAPECSSSTTTSTAAPSERARLQGARGCEWELRFQHVHVMRSNHAVAILCQIVIQTNPSPRRATRGRRRRRRARALRTSSCKVEDSMKHRVIAHLLSSCLWVSGTYNVSILEVGDCAERSADFHVSEYSSCLRTARAMTTKKHNFLISHVGGMKALAHHLR